MNSETYAIDMLRTLYKLGLYVPRKWNRMTEEERLTAMEILERYVAKPDPRFI